MSGNCLVTLDSGTKEFRNWRTGAQLLIYGALPHPTPPHLLDASHVLKRLTSTSLTHYSINPRSWTQLWSPLCEEEGGALEQKWMGKGRWDHSGQLTGPSRPEKGRTDAELRGRPKRAVRASPRSNYLPNPITQISDPIIPRIWNIPSLPSSNSERIGSDQIFYQSTRLSPVKWNRLFLQAFTIYSSYRNSSITSRPAPSPSASEHALPKSRPCPGPFSVFFILSVILYLQCLLSKHPNQISLEVPIKGVIAVF